MVVQPPSMCQHSTQHCKRCHSRSTLQLLAAATHALGRIRIRQSYTAERNVLEECSASRCRQFVLTQLFVSRQWPPLPMPVGSCGTILGTQCWLLWRTMPSSSAATTPAPTGQHWCRASLACMPAPTGSTPCCYKRCVTMPLNAIRCLLPQTDL